MPIYPVWIHDKKTPRPDGPIVYEISANGAFLHKETPFWKAVVPVRRISILEEQRPQFEFLLPSIPRRISKTVARFFAWITREHNTEALALLWWSEQGRGDYSVTVPPQQVAFGRIEYDIPQRNGFRLIGTLHSHGSMSAFHSAVDRYDEINFDGIHGTLGDFSSFTDSNKFSLSLQASINETRFGLEPWIWVAGIDKIEPEKKSSPTKQSGADKKVYDIIPRPPARTRSNIEEYRLSDGEELLPRSYKPPPKWLENIKFTRFWGFDKGKPEPNYPKTLPWDRSNKPAQEVVR